MEKGIISILILFLFNSHAFADSGWIIDVHADGYSTINYQIDHDDSDMLNLNGLFYALKSWSKDEKDFLLLIFILQDIFLTIQ